MDCALGGPQRLAEFAYAEVAQKVCEQGAEPGERTKESSLDFTRAEIRPV